MPSHGNTTAKHAPGRGLFYWTRSRHRFWPGILDWRGLLGAPRARTALPPSRRGRDWLTLPGLLPPEALTRSRGLCCRWEIFSSSVCGRGMTCTDTSSPTHRGGPCVCRSFYCADIAAYHHGHVAGADVFLANEHDVRSLDHRVGCLDSPNESFGLDHSQGFEWHASGTVTECRRCPQCDDGKAFRIRCRSQRGRSQRSITDSMRGERRFRSPDSITNSEGSVAPVHSARPPDKV